MTSAGRHVHRCLPMLQNKLSGLDGCGANCTDLNIAVSYPCLTPIGVFEEVPAKNKSLKAGGKRGAFFTPSCLQIGISRE